MKKNLYVPKVGDEVYFRFFNGVELKFYGDIHHGKITQDNGDGTFKIHVESGYTYSAIKRKEIKGQMREKKFIVRLYDGGDGIWIDCTPPISEAEAKTEWNLKTGNGTHNTKYEDFDYYKIFPADTKMLYASEVLDANNQ